MESIRTPKIDNVGLVERFSSRKNSGGALYLTATHLIYVDHENKRETWILHSHISSVGKLPLTPGGSPLLVRTKTFLSMTFIVPRERDAHDLYTSLTLLCQPETLEELYCFRFNMSGSEGDMTRETGWSFFELLSDFERMGVPNEFWSMTHLNKDYELCDTYPRFLHVPSSAPTSVLMGSSRFRSKGRLPVLTYLHASKAALCRCSQPLSGFSARCVEDEALLVGIQKANPNTSQLVVVDTRPRINAMANRAAGKGYESEANYENTRFLFAGIDNIHVMRSSLLKLLETCELKVPQMGAFLSGLEGSGWTRHIKSILDTAYSVAKTIEDGSSVLVHCSDGWDRTAQVCGLAQILLDPYYRTLHGFQALITKEWLSFGHKFTDRCGHASGDPKEISPVFTQWLECIWQLSQQFPSLFQFNDRLLLCIHDHVHSCQFGTFVGNCEKDRVDLRLNERTWSLWGFIANSMGEFINPLYRQEVHPGLIHPNLAPQTLRFWREMFCRFEHGLHPRESLTDLMIAAKDHINSLDDHIRLLQKRIKLLEDRINSPECNGDLIQNKKNIYDEMNLKLQESEDFQYDPLMVNCKRKETLDDESPIRVHSEDVIDMISDELESVALEWRSVRGVKECRCSAPLDFTTRKSHCWRCGEIYCSRCLDKWVSLPGHNSQKQSPVCRECYRLLLRSSSIECP